MRRYIVDLVEWNARRRLKAHAGLQVAPTAKLRHRRLKMQPNNVLRIGEGSMFLGDVAFERDGAVVIIGGHTSVNTSHIVCADRVEIGDDVLVSWGCTIVDHDSHSISWLERQNDVKEAYYGRKDWTHIMSKPVKLGNKCWIGMHSIILKGVEIGEGAIVAAGSVVTKEVPPWTIVGGNPARVIREIRVDER